MQEIFDIPQSRQRCFMVSILKSKNKYYEFPKPHKTFKVLSDILLDDVPDNFWLNTTNFPNFIRETHIVPYKVGRYRELLLRSFIEISTKIFNVNQRVYYDNGLSNTLTTKHSYKGTSGDLLLKVYIKSKEAVRGLTPKEHFRLMGVKDSDFNKLTVSDYQKYKQAGNSIVVNVLMAIFENLFIKETHKRNTLL